MYTAGMGILALLVSIGIMVLGAGYYYFGMSASSISLTNDAVVPPQKGLALYEDVKERAQSVEASVEERVEAERAMLEAELENERKLKERQPSVPTDTKPAVDETEKIVIIDRLMTSGYAVPTKPRTIDTLVLHSSYNPNGGDKYSVDELVKIYESYGVSAHYLIDRKGNIYRLVEDQNVAYHAGASKMPDGRKDVNNFSLGIELMNTEETEYTGAQYEAITLLIASLKKKHGIKYIVGHNNVAPDRKTDPWNFDWKRLEE